MTITLRLLLSAVVLDLLVGLLQLLHQHGDHHIHEHKLRYEHERYEEDGRQQRVQAVALVNAERIYFHEDAGRVGRGGLDTGGIVPQRVDHDCRPGVTCQ